MKLKSSSSVKKKTTTRETNTPGSREWGKAFEKLAKKGTGFPTPTKSGIKYREGLWESDGAGDEQRVRPKK